MSAVNLVICLMRLKKKKSMFIHQSNVKQSGWDQYQSLPLWKGEFCWDSISSCCFFEKNVTPLQEGRVFFYRQPWSAMWVNWACFLECPRQQYHFPSGTSGCFRRRWCFHTSCKLSFCCGLQGGQDFGGSIACASVSLAADRHGSVFTANPGSHPSAYWASNTFNWLSQDHSVLTIPSIKTWFACLSFTLTHFESFTYICWLIVVHSFKKPIWGVNSDL